MVAPKRAKRAKTEHAAPASKPEEVETGWEELEKEPEETAVLTKGTPWDKGAMPGLNRSWANHLSPAERQLFDRFLDHLRPCSGPTEEKGANSEQEGAAAGEEGRGGRHPCLGAQASTGEELVIGGSVRDEWT